MSHRSLLRLLALTIGLLALALPASALAGPATYTGTDPFVDGPGRCLNGNQTAANGPVNCNIYTGKQYVWLNAGPDNALLDDGTYFFAVLAPSGQADPNDGSTDLLSQDTYDNRTFTVSGGTITYTGGHDVDGNKIRLMDYADTPNPGGVYILAICGLDGSQPVTPSACKYDAFKAPAVECETDCGGVTAAAALTVSKDADGSKTRTYSWGIDKSADKSTVQQTSGSVTVNYTVAITHDGGTVSDRQVIGTISVVNPNLDGSTAFPVSGVDVTDELSDGTVCDVTGGAAATLTDFGTDFGYSCDLTADPQGQLDNTVTVTWPEQLLGNGDLLSAGTTDFTFSDIPLVETAVDDCIDVSDTVQGALGTVCASDPSPRNLTYWRTFTVAPGCTPYPNTASFETNTTQATGSDSLTVTICGPVKTGARTIGFWKNSNGNGLISGYCAPAGKTTLAAYLASLAPFADATGKSCSQLVTYVNGIISKATATNMNTMLKAQMLATALSVYFTGTGWTGTQVGKVKPPSAFFGNTALGGFAMDLRAICPMVDNTTAGTAACANVKPSTNGYASGAFPWASQTVTGILTFASTAGVAPWTTGAFTSPSWYGTDRTKQEILKNVFDQINNELAFSA